MFRDHKDRRILAPGAIDAAVMIPLVEKDGKDHVLFELRSSRIEQGGEVFEHVVELAHFRIERARRGMRAARFAGCRRVLANLVFGMGHHAFFARSCSYSR